MIDDHPHNDPEDGREECLTCGKWVSLIVHSCKGMPVTDAAKARGHAKLVTPVTDQPKSLQPYQSCQRCGELADRCECPRYLANGAGMCRRCSATRGQHLLDFTDPDPDRERLVCP